MRLRVHIGTEKTGSSHLQTLAACGRDSLSAAGLHFPYGWRHDEHSMLSGRISAGNARLLAQAVDRESWGDVGSSLVKVHHQASGARSGQVLLSSEWLLSALSVEGRLGRFRRAAKDAGFTEVDFALVLRDPLDQCLSLYKHRAKRGTAGTILKWCSKGYTLPRELSGFREQIERDGIDLSVWKYKREPGRLEWDFFAKWLGVRVPEMSLPSTVNASPTLSELALIRHVAAQRPALVQPLYTALMKVPTGKKLQGKELAAHASTVAAEAVAHFEEEWRAWNQRLPEDEELTIPAVPSEVSVSPDEVAFSEKQLQAIGHLMGSLVAPGTLVRLVWWSRLRPILSRVKRATVARGSAEF